MIDTNAIRKDFPILARKIHGKKLIYLDNAATTQKPRQVIDAIKRYYEDYNSNVHRAVHTLSGEATDAYDEAHEKAADFINAESYEEIIFTKNTTESLNLVANHFTRKLRNGDEILLTRMEHHSNLVPWQNAARITGAKIRYADVTKSGELDMKQASSLINSKTKVVALTHASNVLGTINNVEAIAEMAHDKRAVVVVDGAQSVPNMPVDVKKLGCDFLAFSAHKMLGPTGMGVLYGRKELLEKMEPFMFGGDMIKEVTFEGASWNELPWKFEAGTPNVAGAIGLSAAIDYLKKIGMDSVREHEIKLTKYAMEKLKALKGTEIYGPAAEKRTGIVSFNMSRTTHQKRVVLEHAQNSTIPSTKSEWNPDMKGLHPHDISSILDQEGIAVRGGHHCAMPLMSLLGIQGSTRASFYIYNTKEEIDALMRALLKARKILGA